MYDPLTQGIIPCSIYLTQSTALESLTNMRKAYTEPGRGYVLCELRGSSKRHV